MKKQARSQMKTLLTLHLVGILVRVWLGAFLGPWLWREAIQSSGPFCLAWR